MHSNPRRTNKLKESTDALETLQTSFDDLNENFASVTDELKDITEKLSTSRGEFMRVDAENKILLEQIETLKNEVAEVSRESVDFDEKVAEKTAETVASIGHEAVEFSEETEEESTADILKTFKSLRGKELVEYHNAHKQEIYKSLRK